MERIDIVISSGVNSRNQLRSEQRCLDAPAERVCKRAPLARLNNASNPCEYRFMNYIVRHGVMRFLGEFEPTPPVAYRRDQNVIIHTERGLEVGDVLCESSPRAMKYLQEPAKGKIVRVMNDEDRVHLRQAQEREEAAFHCCAAFIDERHLQMELVDVEQLFGGERIIFYFLAEKRVDFRELVKDLAREYRTDRKSTRL